jgi:hypothetical protein
MTPQEKAIELVERYTNMAYNFNSYSYDKRCALIAVDEILKLSYFTHEPSEDDDLYSNYWKEVKTEIEKL